MAVPKDGYYLDPHDAEIFRQWVGGRWTANTRTGPNAPTVIRQAAHVGSTYPAPTRAEPASARVAKPEVTAPQATARTVAGGRPASQPIPPSSYNKSNPARSLAVVWTFVAAIVGTVFIVSAKTNAYGGDAYTDIQNAGAQTVRALGVLIISTGPLGLIIALSRR